MKRNARTAFNRLSKAGFKCFDPVNDRPSWGGGHFDISGETGDPRVDFWEQPDIPEIRKILDDLDLFAEWCNPGVLTVFDA